MIFKPDLFVSIATMCLLTSCAGTYKHELKFNPSEPLRVAVLPFQQVDSGGKVITDSANTALDSVPFVSEKLSDPPAVFVRKLVQSELQKSKLDLVAPAYVDTQLSHHGFGTAPFFNREKLQSTPATALCEMLSCDAVLYGTVTEWDRSYYGIQAVSTVAVHLRMVRASDGAAIFTASAEDSDSRGISKGPTGISSIVLEPIKGLSNTIITDTASRLVTSMIKPVLVASRPEPLDSFPPAIFASSHDGRGRGISVSAPLTVVMLGTPKEDAYFSIGSIIEQIPMVEKDEGHYIGQYYPLAPDRVSAEPVFVYLRDKYGRLSEQKVGMGSVSVQESP